MILIVVLAGPAAAQTPLDPPLVPDRVAPIDAAAPQPGDAAAADAAGLVAGDGPEAQFNLDLGNTVQEPSQSLTIIVLLTLLSLAPSLLVMMTSFTRIVIVLSIVRQAIGLPTVPPNQIVVGLALFLSIFTMAPTLQEINEVALQPLLASEIDQGEAIGLAQAPIREFMMGQVGEAELALFVDASGEGRPATPDDVAFTSLVPAFVLSELKAAFIIAFVVFIPFLIVDLITASVLMSMGMMMLPPVLVSLPFKLLLFVMVDGWTLVVRSLLESFAT
ncbi:flagellar type III secretion system pore protein FliP [Euzebya sp.]|uniref:flagellar type III secretion system pore protein FliP n=1 Tax=Euzebya sp. TaxID=1971409 RepID=UPI003517616D